MSSACAAPSLDAKQRPDARWLATLILVAAGCATATPATSTPPRDPRAPARYVLLEPVLGRQAQGLPVMRELALADSRRRAIERVLAKPYQRWILALGAEAMRRAGHEHPAYFVIVKGGNQPRSGLAIAEGQKVRALPGVQYAEVDAERATTLIPHEYSHVMMGETLREDLPADQRILPHTTGAITDDVTAFFEGWSIHFETLAGDRREDEDKHAFLHRDGFATDGTIWNGDSFLLAKDLCTYSQSYRRYACVKENCFAYLPRTPASYVHGHVPTAEDVLARWTDTTFDPARLRSLEQLVASEGVVATLFYRLATAPTPGGARGLAGDPPLPDPRRYAAFFVAFAKLTAERARRTPVVLLFLEELLQASGHEERRRIARIALEVFHYTLALPEAPQLYAELHAAGHQVDLPRFKRKLDAAAPQLAASVERLARDPRVLETIAAPELWLQNDALKLSLPIVGLADAPLVVDLNTVPLEMLMTISGVSYAEAQAIDEGRRQRRGFRAIDEVGQLDGVRPETVAALRSMRSSYQATLSGQR